MSWRGEAVKAAGVACMIGFQRRFVLCADGDEAEWLSASGSVLTDPTIAGLGDFDSTAVTIRTKQGRLCQINTSRRTAYGYDQRFGDRALLRVPAERHPVPHDGGRWREGADPRRRGQPVRC